MKYTVWFEDVTTRNYRIEVDAESEDEARAYVQRGSIEMWENAYLDNTTDTMCVNYVDEGGML